MKVTEILPYAILDNFPTQTDALKKLFRENKDFQTICYDYQRCFKALNHWNNSDSTIATQRQREYQELLSELNDEILILLKTLTH